MKQYSVVTPAAAKDSSYSVETEGFVLVGHGGYGLMAEWRKEDGPKSAEVYLLSSVINTPDGRAAITFGGTSYDGHQTPGGLFFRGTPDAGPNRLVATSLALDAFDLSLSNPTGLYQLKMSSGYYTARDTYISNLDWSGEAIALVARDSIYLQVSLTNSMGGTSGAYFQGPSSETRFSLRSQSGFLVLEGNIVGGKLHATWKDTRAKGNYFKGHLEGTRY